MMHASSASQILSAVETALSELGTPSITVVGHSLGGALALLDGIYFRLHFSRDVSVRVITYGMPRVGNQPFADFVDNTLSGLVTHVNNREDPIPTVPGIILGFHHGRSIYRILVYGTLAPVRFSFFLRWLACGWLGR
jgi:predicted lipase